MARLRLLRKVLAGSRPPKPVQVQATTTSHIANPVAVPVRPKYPDPTKYSSHSKKIFDRVQQDVAAGRPHFPIGGKEIYFPWSPITLLPPSAKMTPYQAQFQVPRDFNKLDMRDYLWHLYGLRALSISTQLKWSQWHRRGVQRYRTSQVKKMIIEMEDPFVWPSRDTAVEEQHQKSSSTEFTRYEEEMSERQGSDLKKPAQAFDGVLGPYPQAPAPYVPVKLKAQLKNRKAAADARIKRAAADQTIARFLKL